MSKATLELDFLGIQKQASSSKSKFRKFLDRRRSFRVAGMQSAISIMDREVVKSVMNGNAAPGPGPGPGQGQGQGQGVSGAAPLQTAPLTIFYNGGVAVFDLPRDKAENILKLADQVSSKGSDPVGNTKSGVRSSSGDEHQLLDTLNGDLPIARKKSLERFLEKRKERLTTVSC